MAKRTTKKTDSKHGLVIPGGAPPASPVRLDRWALKWLVSPFSSGTAACLSLVLFGVVAWIFWPSLDNGFVCFDDGVYITANNHVQQGLGWEGIRWAFGNLDAGFWHPLTWLSIMLDCQIFGLQAAGHHLTSLLIHAANTVLLFLVFWNLTGAGWRSIFVAALFALHPLHVESVAWASDRKDVLCTFFWLLTMLMYGHYARKRSQTTTPVPNPRSVIRDYLLALFFFVCGLMSKPMIVTLPLILLLMDWWPLGRFQCSSPKARTVTLLVEKLPFFVAALVSGLLTLRAEEGVGAVTTTIEVPVASRIANAMLSYAEYLSQVIWPTNLAVFYPYPGAFSIEMLVLVAGLLGAATVVALWAVRVWPWLAFSWTWYLLTLLPVIGLIQVGSHAHADRYTYVPLIGVFVGLVWGACELMRGRRYQSLVLALAGGAVLWLCVFLTRQQIRCWRDDETLFRHALAVTEGNWLAHNNVGTILVRQKAFDEAILQLQQAVKLNPGYAEAHNNLGAALAGNNAFDEAIPQFQQALKLKPDYAEAHYNLGKALDKQGASDEAITQCEAAVRLKPDYIEAHYSLAVALLGKGRLDEAIAQFQEVLRLQPLWAEAHNDLGVALRMQGRITDAVREFQEALRLKPNYPLAYDNFTAALGAKTNPTASAAALRQP